MRDVTPAKELTNSQLPTMIEDKQLGGAQQVHGAPLEGLMLRLIHIQKNTLRLLAGHELKKIERTAPSKSENNCAVYFPYLQHLLKNRRETTIS